MSVPFTVRSLLAAFLATSLLVGVVSGGHPPRPGTEGNGLAVNESATLWSGDADTCIPPQEYERRYGEERTATEELANCTDITFKEPPATASMWTIADFDNLRAGDETTSVHPPHAELTDSLVIQDAHVTMFAVQPSTRVHLSKENAPLYIAPEGTLRALVDYRVRPSVNWTEGNETTRAKLVDHKITEVRLVHEGEAIAAIAGEHTPVLQYELDGSRATTLTLEADIEATVEAQKSPFSNSTQEVHTDAITVSQTIPVEIYDLAASTYYATYPDGSTGLAVYQNQPWHGYTLTADGNTSVRGVWRYYTARESDWDSLVQSQQNGSEKVHSPAHPVYVHAFPSRIGPRSEPAGSGPEILDVWGYESEPPASLGQNVSVGVVSEPYTRTYGMAIRHEAINRDEVEIQGIVRGVSATIVESAEQSERSIRASELSLEVVERSTNVATIRVELRDTETGVPIALANPAGDDPRYAPLFDDSRRGYIALGDERVKTNDSGVALLTVRQPGIYSAVYHPGSWRTHDPAYTRSSASVSWHPLSTLSGWVNLAFEVLWWSIPFVAALYAGVRLGSFFQIEDYP